VERLTSRAPSLVSRRPTSLLIAEGVMRSARAAAENPPSSKTAQRLPSRRTDYIQSATVISFTNDVTGQSLLHDEGASSECDRRFAFTKDEPTRYWLGDGFCGSKCRLIKEMIMTSPVVLIPVD